MIMALRIHKKMGEMTITQNQDREKKKFKNFIYTCNALAAFVYNNYWTEVETGKKHKDMGLYSFFADTQHVKNIMKHEGKLFWDEVSNIKLNTFYKESATLIKIFTKAGYKVTAYYKEVKL